MKYTRSSFLLSIATAGALLACEAPAPTRANSADTSIAAVDPMPSWNAGATKQAIIDFVQRTTTEGGTDFVPVPERIAVFDNDGTLWSEAPMPPQLAFVLHEIKRRAPNEPALAKDPMVKAALAGDLATLAAGKHHDGLMHLLALTHAGITVPDYQANVREWMKGFQQPKGGAGLAGATYQPVLELLTYLRANGYKTFIVSGGGIDFMRVFAEELYGIPPEQVVGSSAAVDFELVNGVPTLTKTMEDIFVDDKDGKPAGIHRHIGRRPVFCAGNSDGDQAMLEYTTLNNPRPSFGLIVHHTDSVRETAYDAKPPVSGTLISALTAAPKHGWLVVDMVKDWNDVFVSAK
ncbi:MAG TPA: HAD family hydrolase [Flavobacteriales bacterium]|nr:HAD family hydrolase [Flavobacteriales bacterium]